MKTAKITSLPPGDVARGRFDTLVRVLEGAGSAFRLDCQEARDAALSEGISTISALYGALDPTRSPEVAAHLATVYDTCLRALADAYNGDDAGLEAATTTARSLRACLHSQPGALVIRGLVAA
jgi:hypothetical protein